MPGLLFGEESRQRQHRYSGFEQGQLGKRRLDPMVETEHVGLTGLPAGAQIVGHSLDTFGEVFPCHRFGYDRIECDRQRMRQRVFADGFEQAHQAATFLRRAMKAAMALCPSAITPAQTCGSLA